MYRPVKAQLFLAGTRALALLIDWQNTDGLAGTEFSGGWLTGPLLSMADFALIALGLAVVLAFVFPRVAAVLGLVSSGLCLPYYLFTIAPDPFARAFARGHEFSVPPAPGVHLYRWPTAGTLIAAVTIGVCVRVLLANKPAQVTAATS